MSHTEQINFHPSSLSIVRVFSHNEKEKCGMNIIIGEENQEKLKAERERERESERERDCKSMY